MVDNNELIRQSGDVKEAWGDAITEVVLEMLEMQRKEEDMLRRDPLSILTINKKANKTELKRKFGDTSLEQLSTRRQEKTTVKFQRADQSNPCRDDGKRYFKLLSSHLSGDVEDLQKEIEQRERREKEASDGDPCVHCGSKWTFNSNLSSFDISKAEVWGNKDVAETFTTTCKDCGHVATTSVR